MADASLYYVRVFCFRVSTSTRIIGRPMTLAILITASGSVCVVVALVADTSVIVILRTTAIT